MIFKHSGLYIDKSPVHGWGVFINEDIKKDSLLEEAPIAKIIELRNDINLLTPYLMRPAKENERPDRWFIPTGFSIHLNHADVPNVEWKVDYETNIAYFYAAQDIKANEELFISYLHQKIQ